MQDNPSTQQNGAPRWMKIVLGVSLALNLAIVGMVAGAALRHDRGPAWAKKAPGLSAFGAPYILALPREDRRAVRRALRTSDDSALPTRAMRREMYAQVLDALRTTPFEPKKLENAVSRQTNVSVSVQSTVKTEWLKIVAQMSDDERIAYAFAVEDVLRRGPKRR